MSRKQIVTVYCGVSASGKSTCVGELRKLGWKFVELNRDEWRFKLFTEGVIVRIDRDTLTPLFLKSKSFVFRCLEGHVQDTGEVDIEEVS